MKDQDGLLVHGLVVKESAIESLSHSGVLFSANENRFSAQCNSFYERDIAVSALNSNGFKCGSEFEVQTGTWLVFSTGLHADE